MTDVTRDDSISVLLIGDLGTDRQLVRELFGELGWRLFEADNRRRGLACLKENPVQVVIAGQDLPKWNWKKVLADLRSRPLPPQLIVASRNADDYLWAEALNVGAFDVLAQPFDREEMERVVSSARRHFEGSPLGPGRNRPAASANVA